MKNYQNSTNALLEIKITQSLYTDSLHTVAKKIRTYYYEIWDTSAQGSIQVPSVFEFKKISLKIVIVNPESLKSETRRNALFLRRY